MLSSSLPETQYKDLEREYVQSELEIDYHRAQSVKQIFVHDTLHRLGLGEQSFSQILAQPSHLFVFQCRCMTYRRPIYDTTQIIEQIIKLQFSTQSLVHVHDTQTLDNTLTRGWLTMTGRQVHHKVKITNTKSWQAKLPQQAMAARQALAPGQDAETGLD